MFTDFLSTRGGLSRAIYALGLGPPPPSPGVRVRSPRPPLWVWVWVWVCRCVWVWWVRNSPEAAQKQLISLPRRPPVGVDGWLWLGLVGQKQSTFRSQNIKKTLAFLRFSGFQAEELPKSRPEPPKSQPRADQNPKASPEASQTHSPKQPRSATQKHPRSSPGAAQRQTLGNWSAPGGGGAKGPRPQNIYGPGLRYRAPHPPWSVGFS